MEEEVQTFGIGDTFEVEGPDGQPLRIKGNPKKGPNDLGNISLETELRVRPRSENVCGKCGRIHPVDKAPICLCAKCGKVSRIVRAGQCVECAYQFIGEKAAANGVAQEDIDNLPIFREYVKWKKKQETRIAEEGMPWERQ